MQALLMLIGTRDLTKSEAQSFCKQKSLTTRQLANAIYKRTRGLNPSHRPKTDRKRNGQYVRRTRRKNPNINAHKQEQLLTGQEASTMPTALLPNFSEIAVEDMLQDSEGPKP